MNHFTVTSAGFVYYSYSQYTESTLDGFGCFKLSGGLAFADKGGVANPATVPATQLGYSPIDSIGGGPGAYGNVIDTVAPDTALQSAFYFVATQPLSTYNYVTPDGIEAVNLNTFMPSGTLFMDLEKFEGPMYTWVWTSSAGGRMAFVALTSSGNIYLLRGAFVVPEELESELSRRPRVEFLHNHHPRRRQYPSRLSPVRTSFPESLWTWNGSYRTTTILDATHVSVAVSATDLAAAGSVSLVALNPGAPASSTLSVTIN